ASAVRVPLDEHRCPRAAQGPRRPRPLPLADGDPRPRDRLVPRPPDSPGAPALGTRRDPARRRCRGLRHDAAVLSSEPRHFPRRGGHTGRVTDRRPEIDAPVFRDADGRVIDYGNRWSGSPPEDTYSVDTHPERFAPLSVVADALVDHLRETFEVEVDAEEIAADPVH